MKLRRKVYAHRWVLLLLLLLNVCLPSTVIPHIHLKMREEEISKQQQQNKDRWVLPLGRTRLTERPHDSSSSSNNSETTRHERIFIVSCCCWLVGSRRLASKNDMHSSADHIYCERIIIIYRSKLDHVVHSFCTHTHSWTQPQQQNPVINQLKRERWICMKRGLVAAALPPSVLCWWSMPINLSLPMMQLDGPWFFSSSLVRDKVNGRRGVSTTFFFLQIADGKQKIEEKFCCCCFRSTDGKIYRLFHELLTNSQQRRNRDGISTFFFVSLENKFERRRRRRCGKSTNNNNNGASVCADVCGVGMYFT